MRWLGVMDFSPRGTMKYAELGRRGESKKAPVFANRLQMAIGFAKIPKNYSHRRSGNLVFKRMRQEIYQLIRLWNLCRLNQI